MHYISFSRTESFHSHCMDHHIGTEVHPVVRSLAASTRLGWAYLGIAKHAASCMLQADCLSATISCSVNGLSGAASLLAHTFVVTSSSLPYLPVQSGMFPLLCHSTMWSSLFCNKLSWYSAMPSFKTPSSLSARKRHAEDLSYSHAFGCRPTIAEAELQSAH